MILYKQQDGKQDTVKPVFFRVPFISRISRAWQVRNNNGPRIIEYSSVSV